MADYCPSPEERNVIIGVCVTLVYVMDAWTNSEFHSLLGLISPVLIYPAAEAPHYKVGYKAAAAFAVASILFTWLFKHLAERRSPVDVESGSFEAPHEAQDDAKDVVETPIPTLSAK